MQQHGRLFVWSLTGYGLGFHHVVPLEVHPERKQSRGRKAYCPLLLIKMLFVGQWHMLSDWELESYVRDVLSARHFCGLAIEDSFPDRNTISRVRMRLVSLDAAWDGSLGMVN